MWSYKRALIRLLDRPGGRFVLGKMATRFVRRVTGNDFELRYINGLWTHRVASHFFPDSVGFNYEPSDFDGWKTQLDRYKSDTKEYWLRHYDPQEGDLIVDVGAGRGEDTLTFSRSVGNSGRVIAIEPYPLSFAILKSFCQLNGLKNVTALNLALMDEPGLVRITESEGSWMENVVQRDDRASGGIRIPAATLDEISEQQGLGSIAFLKMNIEGSERYALLGMERLLPHIRQICVACHDFRAELGDGEHFRTRGFVEKFLAEYGFTPTSRLDDSRDYVRDHVFGLR